MSGRSAASSRPGSAVVTQNDVDVSSLPGARTGWTSKLSLNTAVPLSMLGLRVTRDLVPNYASTASPATSVGSNNEATSSADKGAGVAQEEDALATLPIFMESERSYGERMAGEPAFSRDLRRGLLLAPRLPTSVPERATGAKDARGNEEASQGGMVGLVERGRARDRSHLGRRRGGAATAAGRSGAEREEEEVVQARLAR